MCWYKKADNYKYIQDEGCLVLDNYDIDSILIWDDFNLIQIQCIATTFEEYQYTPTQRSTMNSLGLAILVASSYVYVSYSRRRAKARATKWKWKGTKKTIPPMPTSK